MRKSQLWQTLGFVVAAAVASVLTSAGPPYRATDAFGVGLAVLAAGCLLRRQAAPIPVLVATALVVVANAAAGYPPTVVPWATWVALFTCFSVCTRRYRAVAVVVTLAAVAGHFAFDRGAVQVEAVFGVTMTFLIAVVAGDAVRSRGAAAAAEQARQRAEERTELARELHDSLGHAVNVVVMQAGVARRVFDENPRFAREALGHIETVGRDALGELDRLVRVVRTEQPPPELAALAEHVRAAGRELRLRAEQVELGAGTAHALHRIAQEAITNALRHTDSGRIDVRLRQVGETAVLEVVNEGGHLPGGRPGRDRAELGGGPDRGEAVSGGGPDRGEAVPRVWPDRGEAVLGGGLDRGGAVSGGRPGHGLANMRERARLAGGELEAGPFEGGFRVRATLPTGAHR
ncbi:sensor histidine kinase [Actinokineospora spheciospongiae]|uniref:sensor histidine kinase n=1 Tax=Actinokineospora spheciospongiae TaxID=909613 RepID=UPI0011B764EF|nr:histidine kinase [Actinokineospora spheciospongiae]